MKRAMDKSKLIATIISIIIGIILSSVICYGSPAVRLAFTESKPTQDEYNILAEYALEEAKGVYLNLNDDIKVDRQLVGEELIIEIETSRLYGVKARFPISNLNLEVDNGTIDYKGTIDYNNATYFAYTEVKDKIEIFFAGSILAVIFSFAVYAMLYGGIISIIKVTFQAIKNKKKKN